MANITIPELQPAGADLLNDSESYMRDLLDSEFSLQGGLVNTVVISTVTILTVLDSHDGHGDGQQPLSPAIDEALKCY